jgi:tungstate transport system ATP-binding protein
MSRYLLDSVVRRHRESRTGRVIEALRVRRLDVQPGEILAVVGPNGSGKSTLMETLAFLQRPDDGRIMLDGRDVWAEGGGLAARRRCPLLLQKTVLFKASVLHNVMYGLRARGLGSDEARQKAQGVLRLVRLDTLGHRGHRELSGGERRRVALARLLALESDVLLLDEPTAHVDRANERLIEEAIRDIHARRGITVVFASNNVRQATALADRIVTLIDGRLISGVVDNLLEGTLHRDGGDVVFRGAQDLTLRFPVEALLPDDRPAVPDSAADVQIALDPQRVQVAAGAGEGATSARGRIESVEQTRGRCRLRLRLSGGGLLHAEMSVPDYERLGLNLGVSVGVRIGEAAIRLLRPPSRAGC